jgi:hypothetical protein
MEYVPLFDDNTLPEDCEPVPAGCEKDGLRKLYFGLGRIPKTLFDGIFGNRGEEGLIEVPGKWGSHLGGVFVAYGGREATDKTYGKVLCWKKK